jgi:DNA polymerase sigma
VLTSLRPRPASDLDLNVLTAGELNAHRFLAALTAALRRLPGLQSIVFVSSCRVPIITLVHGTLGSCDICCDQPSTQVRTVAEHTAQTS